MREQISSLHAAMTLPIRYRACLPGVYVWVRIVHLCVFLVLSGGDAGVCLSTRCAYSPRACLSLTIRGLKSSKRLRQCSDQVPKTPMRRSTPSSALSSVVESSQPDDGGQSTTLLLVAFPLPSRSLLAGPDTAISPCTRTKNRLARASSCPALFNFRSPIEKKKKKVAKTKHSLGGIYQFRSTKSARICSLSFS